MDLAPFGVPIFAGVSPAALAGLAAVYLAAYFVKGAFGFGSLTPAILFGSWVVAPHHAVLLAVLANGVSQVQFIPEGLRNGDVALVKRLLPANAVGALIGLAVFATIDPDRLSLVLGICLGLLVLAELLRLPERLDALADLTSTKVVLALALLSGMVSGVTGAGGLFFLVALVRLVVPEPRAFRATTMLISAAVVLFRLFVLIASGFVTLALALETAVLLPAIVGGGWLGARCFRRLPARVFYAGIQVLLLLGAAGLVWKGWP